MFNRKGSNREGASSEGKSRALNYEQIGNRIRDARKEKGFTQADLAAEAEISDTYVCYIETGHKKVSMDVLLRIAEALGVSISHLLYGDYPESSGTFLPEFKNLLSDCDTREMEAIYTISRSAKDALRQYRSAVS